MSADEFVTSWTSGLNAAQDCCAFLVALLITAGGVRFFCMVIRPRL
jgi:hypothetical protein